MLVKSECNGTGLKTHGPSSQSTPKLADVNSTSPMDVVFVAPECRSTRSPVVARHGGTTGGRWLMAGGRWLEEAAGGSNWDSLFDECWRMKSPLDELKPETPAGRDLGVAPSTNLSSFGAHLCGLRTPQILRFGGETPLAPTIAIFSGCSWRPG